MLAFLPAPVRGAITFLMYVIFTVALFVVFIGVALLKLTPVRGLRIGCSGVLNALGDLWVWCADRTCRLTSRIRWDVRGADNLRVRRWCLLISNHQTWVDIIVLARIFSGKIPPYKFFIKKELLWVPFMGFAFWALDFPIMKRYSRQFLEKNPHLRGRDMETTRKSCEKFKQMPVSIINFVEGTRFRKDKHEKQQSPFTHLLKPRAGGTAMVLYAMGDLIEILIDVTIAYPDGVPGLWAFFCGREATIRVDIELSEIDPGLKGQNYFEDPEFRRRFQEWLNALWTEKDRRMDQSIKP
ncbi:MAG: acyltransferase [Thermodesulfobacteriota bacterium]